MKHKWGATNDNADRPTRLMEQPYPIIEAVRGRHWFAAWSNSQTFLVEVLSH
jgi:hypothetical protein